MSHTAGEARRAALHDEAAVEARHLRALLADTLDLAAVMHRDGRLQFLNRGGHRLLAVPPDHGALDRSLLELVVPSERQQVEREIRPALRTHGWWSGNLTLLTAAGTEVPTRSTLRMHRDADGVGATVTWIARDITTEKAVYERLHRKIFQDELTGLPHRSIFLDRLDLALRRPDQGRHPIVLLYASLDRFKDKNERFGREVGDELLRAVGRRLDQLRGPGDTVSRWGGDEFVYMCDGLRAGEAPADVATRVLAALEAPFEVGPHQVFLTMSIGVGEARPGEMPTDQLLRRAEAAGQVAKRRGGAGFQIFDEAMHARALRRAEVEDALRGAAARGELVLHYQPEVALRTNHIVAVEALVRWQHPRWGLVAPSEFVPVAESSSLILELGGWILPSAMDQCARWRAAFGDRAPTVAVNISALQFAQDDFVEAVADTLEQTGADPSDICLEITESVLMADVDVTAATLKRLKALGVRLAIDDFGTGYSSLSYLRRFPVDILKVDQAFVRGLGHDPEDSAIVQAVVHMGRALQLTTVAEGVETAHHLIELRELDCDIGQGYHFARPRPAEDVTRMLAAGADWPLVSA